ncbi:cation/H(+) antiporter 12-like [Benincasa hispida]|uniref:cation/H(+) antiporter 12-like n=1 Tax=Benincasa hispida TaxID=102211 RepID=UPI001900A59E|nr:cation/H(+) antiporter 12-like [Benincasa hispida]
MEGQEVLVLLSDLGYSLYVFLSVAKVDIRMAMRTRKNSLLIGISALLLPQIIQKLAKSMVIDDDWGFTNEQRAYLPMMISFHAITAFPTVASLVKELHIMNSELGRLGLSSALVCDIFGFFLFTMKTRIALYHINPSGTTTEVSYLIMLILVAFLVLRPIMFWIIKQTPQGMPVKRFYIEGVIFLALLYAVLGTFTGHSPVMGVYVLAMAIPEGAPLASTLVDRIECLVENAFMPIFVVTCALRADLSKISATTFDDLHNKLEIILLFVACTAKFLVCVLSSKYCKLPFKDALALSLIFSCKGPVELFSYTVSRDYHRYSRDRLMIKGRFGLDDEGFTEDHLDDEVVSKSTMVYTMEVMEAHDRWLNGIR